jgi:hypothetical protein
MAQQTAVEWLIEQYCSENYGIEIGEQAKQMEKEQITNAVSYGNWYEFYDAIGKLGEHYYNETYGTK